MKKNNECEIMKKNNASIMTECEWRYRRCLDLAEGAAEELSKADRDFELIDEWLNELLVHVEFFKEREY